jgi:ditrans,polycis-polyprenyl diphosphate synthase
MGGLASRFASTEVGSKHTRFRRATCAVLRAGGPTPRHVAIVMDGNRRFARSRNLRRAEGHEHGADKLVEVLEWCLALDVEQLSVYAFSTENLKRDHEEVAGLFSLAEARLDELARSQLIREKQVRVRVLGDLSRGNVPESLRIAAARVTTATWYHSGPVLNVCFAYTGREDIAQAIGSIGVGVRRGLVEKNEINDDLVEKCLRGAAFDGVRSRDGSSHENPSERCDAPFGARARDSSRWWWRRRSRRSTTVLDAFSVSPRFSDEWFREKEDASDASGSDASGSDASGSEQGSSDAWRRNAAARSRTALPSVPPVDLLIRTSGETRLSDFILWGASRHAVLCFLEVLWPDFSFTDMCHAVWTYQLSARHAERGRRRLAASREPPLRAAGWPETASGGGGSAGTVKARAGEAETKDVSVAWVRLGRDAVARRAAAFVAERNAEILRQTMRESQREKPAP